MKTLKKLLKKYVSLRKASDHKGFEQNNYTSSTDTFQTFRTRQDYQGKQKNTLREKIKLKIPRSENVHANGFSPTLGGKTKKAALFCRGIVAVLLVVAAAYAGRGYALDLVSEFEYFHVQEMVIHGCKVSTQDEIKELGGFSYGTSLFTINPEKIAQTLMGHAWVDQVKIQRHWPDRLIVTIKEFKPEALLTQKKQESEGLFYVNRKGVCFSPVQPGEDIDYPVITGVDALLDENDRKQALADALYFLKLAKMNNPNLPAQLVSEINIDATEGMVIYLVEHPFPIFFGRKNVKKKYKQLRKVLEILYKKRRNQMKISQVEFIRMDYLINKVLVAQSGSG